MPDKLAFVLCDQRYGKGATLSEAVDDCRLVAAAMRCIPESTRHNRSDCRNVARLFSTDHHIRYL